ncbi:Hypothetical predicted protein [Paramuricea clavata]|uniref:Uncharacterized protein n=1 Tax=Paramuricea clavata TaxID=317549 RepID=A0A6S7H7Q7_PARCT|nr:Hypothetical predicted protein [Paramuricea clavata]
MLRCEKWGKIQRPSTASFFRSPRLLYQNLQAYHNSRGSTASKFKPSQLLAELEADDDEGPNISKQRSPTLSSDDDILEKSGIEPTEGPNTSKQCWPTLLSHDDISDKVGNGKRKLFTAPPDENSDESASQSKPPTLPTGSNENEEAVILETKDLKRSIRSLSINLRLLQFANTLVFVLLCC